MKIFLLGCVFAVFIFIVAMSDVPNSDSFSSDSSSEQYECPENTVYSIDDDACVECTCSQRKDGQFSCKCECPNSKTGYSYWVSKKNDEGYFNWRDAK